MLLTTRRVGPDGFGPKEPAWNDWSLSAEWRRLWAEMANACLAAQGHEARIDHRSYAERGIPLAPQNKIGPNAARRARRGEGSERVDEHAAIARRNADRAAGQKDSCSGSRPSAAGREPWPPPPRSAGGQGRRTLADPPNLSFDAAHHCGTNAICSATNHCVR